jgi:hypothetical protein
MGSCLDEAFLYLLLVKEKVSSFGSIARQHFNGLLHEFIVWKMVVQ